MGLAAANLISLFLNPKSSYVLIPRLLSSSRIRNRAPGHFEPYQVEPGEFGEFGSPG